MTSHALVALTLPAVTCLVGCAIPRASEPSAARAVRVVEARVPEAPRGLRYAVTIQPSDQLTLAVKASGYVADLPRVRAHDGRERILQPGDVVRAGTILVRLRDAEYRERLHQAEGGLQEVEASEAKARLDLDRAQTLFAADSLTKPELDGARASLDAAIAREASARAQVAAATLALADCVLAAPADGVVLERHLEVGMLAGAGAVGFVLGRVTDVKAIFGVPDAVVSRMALGERLTMTTEAFPGASFAGRVTGVAPSADPQSRVFAVEVTLSNRDGRLKPGMVGAIEVAHDSRVEPEAVAVPFVALVRSPTNPDGYGVVVVQSADGGDVARARPVTLGGTVGNAVAITAGLRAGERVIVMGATLVADGDPVRVIP